MLLQEYFICKVLEKVCLLESSLLSALFPRNYRMDQSLMYTKVDLRPDLAFAIGLRGQ